MSRTYSDAVRMIERDWARRGISSRGAGLHTLASSRTWASRPGRSSPTGTPADAFDTGLVHGPEARVVCDYCMGDGRLRLAACPDCAAEGGLGPVVSTAPTVGSASSSRSGRRARMRLRAVSASGRHWAIR
jgi:hypothetical protein